MAGEIRSGKSDPDVVPGVQSEALAKLAAVYFRILKVDLTEDTCCTLKDDARQPGLCPEDFSGMSEFCRAFALSGCVHEDDRKEFLHFCSLKNLRLGLAFGSRYISHRYRRIIGSEYHWVSMDLVRCPDFRGDHQTAFLYVRDVNDEYLRQLDMVMRRTAGSVGIVTLRVSGNVCVSAVGRLEKLTLLEPDENMDEYIERVSASIPLLNAREKFCRIFCRGALLESYAKGQKVISFDHSVYCEKNKEYRMYHSTAELIKNSFTGEVEAILYFNDITDSFLAEKIPRMVYQRKYERAAIIDLGQGLICLENSAPPAEMDRWGKKENYDAFLTREMEKYIPENERKALKEAVLPERLQRELDEKRRYTLNVYLSGPDGAVRLKRYLFLYLQRALGMVLAVSEDITELDCRDVLTGGYNRQGFIRRTEKLLNACPDRTEYAILFMNIRNFKAVNEIFGTEAGDSVLRQVYETLQNSALCPEITARQEADHFLCLVKRENLSSAVLLRLCEGKFTGSGKTLRLFGRCGIFLVEPEPMSVTGMIDRARLAKKFISDEYVQPFKVYDKSMQASYIDQAELTGEAAEAISSGQFQVYYQPVVDPVTGRIHSAEALVRWNHPEKGLLSPGVFLPALEESGHISELDWYVVQEVRNFMLRRYQEGKAIVPVSINLSWMDFYDEQLITRIMNGLKNSGIPADAARFEITETSFAALSEDRTRVLEGFRQQGASILIDDFGSGYSSFGMLQDYNFDILKIDISFVRKIGESQKTRSVLKSLIDMAHQIGLKLVAEGAETAEQARFLEQSGCDFIQGYYYYRPMPEEAFVQALEQPDEKNPLPDSERSI